MQHYRVILSAEAQTDAALAKDYYNRISPGLGSRFIRLFRLKVKGIGHRPFAHAIRYKNTRFAQIDKFPYAIHYFVDEANPL